VREAIQILPEERLRDIVDSLVRLVEAAGGAAVIFVGALIGVVKFVMALPKRNPEEFVPVRLSLGRYLALGLEFQLASDVLAPVRDRLLAGDRVRRRDRRDPQARHTGDHGGTAGPHAAGVRLTPGTTRRQSGRRVA
jgi:uncharacterized membrane protein